MTARSGPLLLSAVLAAAMSLVPRAVHASTSRLLALEDLVAESKLILVGTVREIDDRAGVRLEQAEPLTRIQVEVEQVLRGKVAGSQFTMELPVGYLPDGNIVHRSDMLQFTLGDRYVMFLSGADARSPIVSAHNALLRVVSFDKRSIVVGEGGHAILASPAHGLVQLGQVAASLDARYVERLREQDGQAEGGLEPAQHELALRDVAYASDAEEVLRLISTAVTAVDPSAAASPMTPKLPATQGVLSHSKSSPANVTPKAVKP